MALKKMTKQDGFSLVEVLVAMVIFLVVMMGFSILTLTVIKTSTKTKNLSVANNLLIEKMEKMQSLPYSNSNLNVGTYTEDYGQITNYAQFKREIQITEVAAPSNGPPPVLGLKRVLVTVTWDQGKQQISVSQYIAQ